MRVALPARIPANTVVMRPPDRRRDAHALSGKTARAIACVFLHHEFLFLPCTPVRAASGLGRRFACAGPVHPAHRGGVGHPIRTAHHRRGGRCHAGGPGHHRPPGRGVRVRRAGAPARRDRQPQRRTGLNHQRLPARRRRPLHRGVHRWCARRFAVHRRRYVECDSSVAGRPHRGAARSGGGGLWLRRHGGRGPDLHAPGRKRFLPFAARGCRLARHPRAGRVAARRRRGGRLRLRPGQRTQRRFQRQADRQSRPRRLPQRVVFGSSGLEGVRGSQAGGEPAEQPAGGRFRRFPAWARRPVEAAPADRGPELEQPLERATATKPRPRSTSPKPGSTAGCCATSCAPAPAC